MQRLWLSIAGIGGVLGLIGCNATPQNQLSAPPQIPNPAPVVAQAPKEIGRVYLMNRQISLMPPAGFTAMPAAEIKRQYPTSNPPSYVFTNADRSASIAITLTRQPLTLQQLPELKKLMSKHMEKTLPALQWVQQDFIAINGGSWVKLEATSKKQQANLHSDMYFTAFQDRMLGINFSSTTEQYNTLKQDFAKSRNSIQVISTAL